MDRQWDVLIVGAGPVGMLLAGLLGQRGFQVLVLETRTQPPSHSRAIGITPPSLQILSRLGLDASFVQHGIPIRDCHVHGETGYLGCASFRQIAGSYPFILALPQQISMRLLEGALAEFPSVTLQRGAEVVGLVQTAERVSVSWQTASGKCSASARWVIGCDGSRSRVRELLQMPSRGGDYGCHFVMGDFVDRTHLGSDAHLFFTSQGAVEAFPLPDGKRRWIVQTHAPVKEPPHGFISDLVRQRAGLLLPPEDQLNHSSFSPRWLNCAQYHQGRVILCGDAAHVMSPIGGQGMNTGWADAEFVAEMLAAIEQGGAAADPLLQTYNRCRQAAAGASTQRAAHGMWLGTRGGRLPSLLRDAFMRLCLFQGPVAGELGPFFAMTTIPYNTVKKVPCFSQEASAEPRGPM